MDFTGIAALITSLTGLLSLALTTVVIFKLGTVHKLVNSNFTNLDARLQQSLEINVEAVKTLEEKTAADLEEAKRAPAIR